MRGSNHLVVGAAVCGGTVWALGHVGLTTTPSSVAVAAAVGGFGALAADIDEPRAYASNRIPKTLFNSAVEILVPLGIVVALFWVGGAKAGGGMAQVFAPFMRWGLLCVLAAGLLFGLSRVASAVTRHRGATHSLAFAVAGAVFAVGFAVAVGAPWYLGLIFGLGWLTHLATDILTPHGLPSILWPFELNSELAGARRALVTAGVLGLSAVLLGVSGWLLGSIAHRLVAPGRGGAVIASESAGPKEDVELALQRLREASPEIAGTLVEPGAPQVRSQGGVTFYTWSYLDRSADDRVTTRRMTIGLDSEGRIVYADGS
ncbi:MAG: hypothetical protein FDZ75_03440 [Actinobacteria bacterium]|nr:MAG: hypothetical protein FDZ75_03440 [Actinomycetota bacterium]